MKLQSYMTTDCLITSVKPTDKWELFKQMVPCIAMTESFRAQHGLSVAQVLEAIKEREHRGSTGVGAGIAFPHARLVDLTRPIVSIAVLETPIDFEAIDDKPVDIVCMVLTPEARPMITLKIMSQLIRHLRDEALRQRVREAATPAALHRLLCDLDIRLDVSLAGGDIMREPLYTCRRETPLPELTHELARHRQDAVAVIAEDGKLIGEVTCDLLFKFGLPEFFSSLKSVGFVEDYDPFEKYFAEEAGASAGDLLSTSCVTVTPEAPILHIVFALAVKHCSKVYVVDHQGYLAGEIDRSTVLQQIINF